MTPPSRSSTPRNRASSPPAPLRIADAVRPPRVATARARIAAGWYDREDVKERLVDALLEELRRR